MVTECEPFVIVHHEAMGDVDIEPLSLLDTLVQLLRSNITINVMLHNTTPSNVLFTLTLHGQLVNSHPHQLATWCLLDTNLEVCE